MGPSDLGPFKLGPFHMGPFDLGAFVQYGRLLIWPRSDLALKINRSLGVRACNDQHFF